MSSPIIKFSHILLCEIWLLRSCADSKERPILRVIERKLWHDGYLSGIEAAEWAILARNHNISEVREYTDRHNQHRPSIVATIYPQQKPASLAQS
jgi:hypothetical protein